MIKDILLIIDNATRAELIIHGALAPSTAMRVPEAGPARDEAGPIGDIVIMAGAALWEIEWLRKHAAQTMTMGGGSRWLSAMPMPPSPPRDTPRPAGRILPKHAARNCQRSAHSAICSPAT